MHIITGMYRGRSLSPLPDSTIRPTSARSREALFNILMHKIKEDGMPLLQDARFADICCGSGAIGLEAVSRGAAHVSFVDNQPHSIAITRQNADTLGVSGQVEFLPYDATSLLTAHAPYDIIFTDPPYHEDILALLAQQLVDKSWCHAQTLFITEQIKKSSALEDPAFVLKDERSYGKAVLRFYSVNADSL